MLLAEFVERGNGVVAPDDITVEHAFGDPGGQQRADRAGGEAAILIILAGSLSVETPDGEAATATAGDVIGMYETLGGSRFDATLKVLSPVTALRLERDSLFELLADHTDLLQGIFSILLRRGK
ncbi:MAG: Crp/Fnr family transcriptional regulator [Acidobacteria bacterium]|nr:Crp/Fnr family transcriptional regulator [Acidobacteriota bacterium]